MDNEHQINLEKLFANILINIDVGCVKKFNIIWNIKEKARKNCFENARHDSL
jgi:hypothetical protein